MAETKKGPGPILSLDTLVEHYSVRIRTREDEPHGGSLYDLVNPGELSILDYHRLGKYGAQVQTMMGQDEDLSDEQVATLEKVLEVMVAIILRAPAEVRAKLSLSQKFQLLEVFTLLQRGTGTSTEARPAGAESAPSPTGASSSQD